MLNIHTGENRLLESALIENLGRALAEEDCTQYIVVPRQLTLLTERMLIRGMKLRGSFRMRVLSPARLCSLIFDETGVPSSLRIDERGRVMLVRCAIRDCSDQLTIYKNAHRRKGFAEKCAKQLEMLMQGGLSGDDLRACAEESSSLSRMKLNDLAILLDVYNEQLSGQYQDGESELILAASRVPDAAFIRGSRFWFFGFDLTPPTLNNLMAQIAAVSRGELFFALKNDMNARDYDCFKPMERALGRIIGACREQNVEIRRFFLKNPPEKSEISHLTGEIYAYPVEKYNGNVENIHLTLARDPREECMAAAAMCRRLAMEGMKYARMQILCTDLENYTPLLAEAFRIYDVPLFLSHSRPVSRMATAQCLLSALKMIEKGFRSEDVFTLIRTGYTPITRDEGDRIANYAVRRGIEGNKWLRPFTRGDAAEIEALEPVRAKLMEPVSSLRERLKDAGSLRDQLTAVFAFLEDIHAHEKSLEMQKRMMDSGLKESAGELGQAWNRIIGALDQMEKLMGEKKLALRELVQTLTESLDAANVKALPQSGDAVYAQPAGRMLMQKAGALFVLGLSDRNYSGEDGLLSSAQKRIISEKTRAYLGPDETDAARMRRFYLKSNLGMAENHVFFSCPLSGVDSSALRPDMTVSLVREIFPNLNEKGGVNGLDEDLSISLKAAQAMTGAAMADARDGNVLRESHLHAASALKKLAERMPEAQDILKRMASAMDTRSNDAINPASARALYGKMQAMSITRLEKFASCPFSHFMHYGLKPLKIEPFAMDRRDEGNFLHGCVYEFLKQNGGQLNSMSGDAAHEKMSAIADEMLAAMRMNTPMEDSAAAAAQSRGMKAAACRCARVLADHMQGSKFKPTRLEHNFGREDGKNRLMAGDTILEGRIDRVDSHEEGGSLRIIDFKLGGKALSLAGVYHGLQLQLPVYLGAAMQKSGARSAGVYYFNLDEGIVDAQTTDKHEIEKLRGSDFRMTGLLPEDKDLLTDMAPDPEKVFYGQFTKDKKPYASVPCADDVNFRRLVNHTLKMAQMQIDAIRMGQAAASPANFANREPCAYCDWRASCLFDQKIDAKNVRRMKNIKWNEVFDRIAMEQTEE